MTAAATASVAGRAVGTASTADTVGDQPLSVDQALTRLKLACDAEGLNVSVSRCRRLVIQAMGRRQHLTCRDIGHIVHKLYYADPTGNAAAIRVDEARKTLRRPAEVTDELDATVPPSVRAALAVLNAVDSKGAGK